jgi:cell division protein ZapA (FtsZ GTPase activity inhibitor)
MEDNKLQIDLLGISFKIKSNENKEYLENIVKIYKKRIEEAKKQFATTDSLKLSILTGLNLIDELYKQKNSYPSVNEYMEIKKIAERMINNIDEVL